MDTNELQGLKFIFSQFLDKPVSNKLATKNADPKTRICSHYVSKSELLSRSETQAGKNHPLHSHCRQQPNRYVRQKEKDRYRQKLHFDQSSPY